MPTWTGRHGEGGLDSIAPAVRRFGNVSSASSMPGSASFALASGGFLGGSAGMKEGSAPRSSDLLAHLRKRQQNAVAAARGSNMADSGAVGPQTSVTPSSSEVMVVLLYKYAVYCTQDSKVSPISAM